ncbi:hypothetical protein [Mucilaginibacter polytrichastri]|uniref:Uncharacterized protein n=1 Tax=Mucilaginibacter polytrichastri TaxID=1302689 RepID=A0A1Q6A3Z4_9SPHI|nr:hypothetical protein [Mucilaginibacter polytrichastri]OKS88731.1 hypothetical protein RG47T_4209 [Mucilaginibacter polytrichastri]SFT04978.1 hypothetical protein SAMN04487890_10963 [Mucilaginibacter polytrichastri]
MKTIKLNTAKIIAADWHSGQWTALYAFASSGEVAAAQEPLCLAEIEENLNNSHTSPKQVQRLQKLKAYIEYANRKA